MYGIGVMSGTSLDGLDMVMIDLKLYEEKKEIHIVASDMVDYGIYFKRKLSEICHENTATISKITMMNAYLGKFIGEHINAFIRRHNIDKNLISFISSHGQTIFHEPLGGKEFYEVPSTLQIGDISYISELTGLPVIGDFRTADMAAGGQGAPLLSYFDVAFLQDEGVGRAIQNIGGIGNVTYLPPSGSGDVISFDTGPGNVLIDRAVQLVTDGEKNFDEDGLMASKGKVHYELIEKWLKHPYYSLPVPKTTGRELYTEDYLNDCLKMMENYSDEDRIATLSAYTVQTIKQSYESYLPVDELKEIYINGGGSLNSYLMQLLKEAFPQKKVARLDEIGVPGIWKEAIGFAIFGYNTMMGIPNQLPIATGAKREVVMGKVAFSDGNPWKRFEQLRGEYSGESIIN